jgi:hypothetical protein
MGEVSPHITVVAGGTEEGTLVFWDTSQATSAAERWPTYCTDSLLTDNHRAPVVCIREVSAMDAAPDAAGVFGKDKAEAGKTLATMDSFGGVTIWTLLQTANRQLDSDATLTDADLALAIGGRVKAVRMAVLLPPPTSPRHSLDGLLCYDMQCGPADSNQLLIGSVNGKTFRTARFGKPAAPNAYNPVAEASATLVSPLQHVSQPDTVGTNGGAKMSDRSPAKRPRRLVTSG